MRVSAQPNFKDEFDIKSNRDPGIIYFLVNNNYQYIEAERLARELRAAGRRTALIAIPHTLTLAFDPALFDPIITLPRPVNQPWRRAWIWYLGAKSRLRGALQLNAKDTLLLFTEFELLNHLVAITFKEHHAPVCLIEDGGVGTYIPYSIRQHEPYSWKDRLLKASICAIPGMGSTQFTKFNGFLFPMLADRHLDGVYLYRQMTITRSALPVSIVARPRLPSVNAHMGRAIFLNQPLYSHNVQTEIVYQSGLRQILSALFAGFSEVLFKFHPREPAEDRARITREVLGAFPALRIIDDNQPFEVMLADLRPEVIASYNSTPLFNLTGTGVQPLFIFHLLPDLRDATTFAVTHTFLQAWGYRFAADWSEVATGYNAGTQFDNVSAATPLAQLLDRLPTRSHVRRVQELRN